MHPFSLDCRQQVTFKVGKAATSPLVFGASVWKDGNKLADATGAPVTVRRRRS